MIRGDTAETQTQFIDQRPDARACKVDLIGVQTFTLEINEIGPTAFFREVGPHGRQYLEHEAPLVAKVIIAVYNSC